AHHGQLGEAGNLLQSALDLERLVLQYVQVGTVYLHRQSAFEPGERLVDGVFGGLSEVENDAGISLEPPADGVNQLVLGPDPARSLPRLVLIRLEADVELAVEKAGGVGAVVRAPQFGAYDRDLRVGHQDLPDLGSDLARFLERDGIRHGGAHPQRSLVEVGHELAEI